MPEFGCSIVIQRTVNSLLQFFIVDIELLDSISDIHHEWILGIIRGQLIQRNQFLVVVGPGSLFLMNSLLNSLRSNQEAGILME